MICRKANYFLWYNKIFTKGYDLKLKLHLVCSTPEKEKLGEENFFI